MNGYIVTAWRGDGRYKALDAFGSRFFKSEHHAKKFADKCNADDLLIRVHPDGFVVRGQHFVDWRGVELVGQKLNSITQ